MSWDSFRSADHRQSLGLGTGIGGGEVAFSPTTAFNIYDDFIDGVTNGGTPVPTAEVSVYGWEFAGVGATTSAPVALVAGAIGVINLNTDTTSTHQCAFYLGSNGIPQVVYNNITFDTIVRAKLPSGSTTLVSAFVGLANISIGAGENSDNVIGVGFDTVQSDTNFMYVTRSSSTSTRTSSGVAVDNAWHDFRFRSITAGTVLFSIDGGAETPIATNVPSAALAPSCRIATNTTVTRQLQIDFYYHNANITR